MSNILKESDISARIGSAATRMVSESHESVTSKRDSTSPNINFAAAEAVTNDLKDSQVSNQILIESNPNLTRAIEILSGLIVCPNGGHTVTLNYSSESSNTTPSFVDNSTAVIGILDKHFTNNVKMQNNLYNEVYEILALTGSYVTTILPISSLDTEINTAGIESEGTSVARGLLKNKGQVDVVAGLEAGHKNNLPYDPSVSGEDDAVIFTFTDDFNVLNKSYKGIQSTTNRHAAGIESLTGVKSKVNVANILNKRREYRNNPVVRLDVGKGIEESMRPVIKHWPSEAMIPMIFRGDKENPFGYLAVLDSDGYPVTLDEKIDLDKDLRRSRKATDSTQAQIRSFANNFSAAKISEIKSSDDLKNSFNELIEREIHDRLIDGTYGERFTLDDDCRLAEVMFHRHLAKQQTKLLFLSPQHVNYATFDTDDDGRGVSLISKTKLLSTIYTVMFYANFMGSMANAVPQKQLTIDFDEQDADANKSFEMIVSEVIQRQGGSNNFNFNGPSDLMDNLQRGGMQIKMNNVQETDLPNMNIELEDRKRDIRPIDGAFLIELQKMLSMRMGFSPELIDSSFKPEFSSQVVRDNELTARQISRYVSDVSEFLTDRVVKITAADPTLLEECLAAIKGDVETKSAVLEEILANLLVTTPTTEANGVIGNTELIEDALKTIGLIVEVLIPDTIADGVDNISKDHIDGLRDLLSSNFMRDYIGKNTMFKPLIDKVRDMDNLGDLILGEGTYKAELMGVFATYTEMLLKADADAEDVLTEAEQKIEDDRIEKENKANEQTTDDEDPLPPSTVDDDTIIEDDTTEKEVVDPNTIKEPTIDPDVTSTDNKSSDDSDDIIVPPM